MDIPSLFYMETHDIEVPESVLQVRGELRS